MPVGRRRRSQTGASPARRRRHLRERRRAFPVPAMADGCRRRSRSCRATDVDRGAADARRATRTRAAYGLTRLPIEHVDRRRGDDRAVRRCGRRPRVGGGGRRGGPILELSREYAIQRRQFGRTIGSFQAVRHILADMFVQLESSWSSVLYAAASLDERGGRSSYGVDRQGIRGARDAGGRAWRASGLRWDRLHRRASGAPLFATHRRARNALWKRTRPRTQSRPDSRSCGEVMV